jgi:hypothetical protein
MLLCFYASLPGCAVWGSSPGLVASDMLQRRNPGHNAQFKAQQLLAQGTSGRNDRDGQDNIQEKRIKVQ